LLSGVVISFDKFNPSVGKPVGIPLIGEVMASRWAFEAYMVTQFRDNLFEKQFYDLDKTAAISEYKRIYYIPALESKLAYCLNHRSDWRNPRNQNMVSALELLHQEIRNELTFIGEDRFPEADRLAIGKFDSTVSRQTSQFLSVLKQFYANRLNGSVAKKEAIIEALTTTPEKTLEFKAMKEKYANKAVTDAVKNTSAPDRIIEYDGMLVQKIYPIYQDEHRPVHALDFSANFFQPTKHFAGLQIDTLLFNLAVIWSMTIMLYVTLYFDLLKRFIQKLERHRKYRRK